MNRKNMKKLAHSALFIVCAIRAHRTPNEAAWVDNGEGDDVLRPQNAGECATSACLHGAMLAQQIIDSLKALWP
jgi:hypothetical protein